MKIKQTFMNILHFLASLYLLVVYIGVPVYMRDSYHYLGKAKYDFYKTAVLGFMKEKVFIPGILPVMLCVVILLFAIRDEGEKTDFHLSRTDKLMLVYAGANIIATLLSSNKDMAVNGYEGWNMGLITQLCMVGSYFMISRYWQPDRSILYAAAVCSAVIFFMEILNRFWIYPFGTAGDLPKLYRVGFVSTIGNINWFAGYMCVTYPAVAAYYLFAKDKRKRILSIVYLVIAGGAMVTQNSQSAFFGLLFLLWFLFQFTRNDKEKLQRFIELILILLLSWRIVGFFQMIFSKEILILDHWTMFLSESPWMWISIILLILFYRYAAKQDGKTLSLLTNRVNKAILISLAVLLVYIVLNSAGILPDALSLGGPFRYTDEWGNYRGFHWRLALSTYIDMLKNEPLKAIFGTGPDCYSVSLYQYNLEEMKQVWSNSIVTNPHNEYLNLLVNVGIPGIVSFASLLYYRIHGSLKQKFSVIPAIMAACAVCYAANDFVSFPTVITTPVLFASFGMIESWEKNIGK
ncbi:MAG: O-antigen ligase family protein [Bulleidia sp.]|nr:O-antigen ligase family protein [Bulleidia sp.]